MAARSRQWGVLQALAAADGAALDLQATGRLAVAALGGGVDLPPGELLSALFSLASEDEQRPEVLWVLAAAAVTLLRQQDAQAAQPTAADVPSQLLLPALASASTGPPAASAGGRQQALLQAAAGCVADSCCWELGLTILRAAEAGWQASLAASAADRQPNSAAAAERALRALPAVARMQLAAAVVRRTLAAGGGQAGRADSLLHHAAQRTLPAALELLLAGEVDAPSHQADARSRGWHQQPQQQQAAAAAAGSQASLARAAAQHLLPAALQAADRLGQAGPALQQLWEACKQLLSTANKSQRHLGLSLLVQFAGPLLGPSDRSQPGSDRSQPGSAGSQQAPQGPSLREDPAFWQLLRACLREGDRADRKKAAHVLQLAVTSPCGQLAPAWRSFWKVLDGLEELAPHLVKDSWEGEIDRLHPPALSEAGPGSSCSTAAAQPPGGAEDGCATGNQQPSSWTWMEVVWTLGLRHEQQAVQRLALQGFLGRSWGPGLGGLQQERRQQGRQQQGQQEQLSLLGGVPAAFVLDVLLPAAGQAHMWRGQGSAELQDAVSSWIGRYAAGQPLPAQRDLLLQLAGRLQGSGQGRQLQRPLSQTLSAALAAAAQASRGCLRSEQQQLDFLHALQAATASLGANWGAGGAAGSHARGVCGALLQAASAAVPLVPADGFAAGGATGQPHLLLTAAGGWLQQLPLALLAPGGAMHGHAAGWVAAAGARRILPLLAACVRDYMATAPAAEQQQQTSDGWREQAAGLARLAMLLASAGSDAGAAEARTAEAGGSAGKQQLSADELAAAFSGWQTVLSVLYRRSYLPASSAERCLLLLRELLDVCGPQTTAGAAEAGALQPLIGWLIAALALGAAAGELASYTRLTAEAALWQPPSYPGQQQAQQNVGDSARRAHLALACVSSALCLLARQRLELASSAVPASAVGALAVCCQDQLRSFAAAADEGMDVRSTAAWQLAAARLLPLPGCCQALAAAAEAGWLHGQAGFEAAEVAGASLDRVLRLQGLAAEAAAASAPSESAAATAAGSPSALAAYCHRLCWRAAAGLLELQQRLLEAAAEQGSPQQQQAYFDAALASLQRAAQVPALAADVRGLLAQLRCCRLLLPAALDALSVAQQDSSQPAESVAGCPETALAGLLCGAAWQAFQASSARSRRAGLTAAVASTCLHPRLFACPSPSLHAPDGPLQQLLRHLLALGSKSWRVMSIASLQLCGLLALHPGRVEQYSPCLQELLLKGLVDEPGQSGVGDPVDADSAAELAALLAPADAQVAAAFAGSELAPRVAALCLLRCWVEAASGAAGTSSETGTPEAACAAREAGLLMWGRLLDLSATDRELSAARYSPQGAVHRRKVRLWQALAVLCPLAPPERAEQDFDAVLRTLCAAELASVRQYAETCALALLRLRPALLPTKVLPLLHDCASSNNHALSSLVLLAARELVWRLRPHGPAAEAGGASLSAAAAAGGEAAAAATAGPQGGEGQQAELVGEVLAAVTPWALSHVHSLRTFAQLVLFRLYELFPAVPASDPTAAALLRFFRENEDVARLRRGLAHTFCFDSFDLEAAVTPGGMLCAAVEGAFEGAPQQLLEAVHAFLTAERQAIRQDLHHSRAEAATAEVVPSARLSQHAGAAGHPAAGSGSNWQKKGGSSGASAGAAASAVSAAAGHSWADALGTASLLGAGLEPDGTEADLAAAAKAAAAARGGPRQELVVVASLLTKAPNLAGLARTCEVFRASSLVLGDLSVTKQREFTSIAVTAHQWVPLQEVPEVALGPWLQAQAAQGWTLVGLEQTAESVQLQDFCFPPRTVLVLGREKEGIPPPILALLHHTVEIPQMGIIRSLNVHVSGAISVFEFTRQRLLAGRGQQLDGQSAGGGL